MNIVNKVELKLEGFEKCHVICDYDCPVGQLYDYFTAGQSFCLQRMKEAEEAQKAQEKKQEEKEAV